MSYYYYNVGRDKITYAATLTLPPGAVWLVSGSMPFVKNWTHKAPNPMLVLCDSHISSKRM
jgi:hypothetical protein